MINIAYWVLLTRQLSVHTDSEHYQSSFDNVTILICSKNAYSNLTLLVQKLNDLNTLHYAIEILIVDDYSTDYQAQLLKTLFCRFPIKVIKADQNIQGKKAALHTGLMSCTSGIILLTDTDCIPNQNWIQPMIDSIHNHPMVLGYSPLIAKPSLVNTWARYENVITAIQYLGWAKLGRPYMGVGRNMAVTTSSIKQLLLDDLQPDIPGGDDDMLVKYLGKASICLDSKTFIYTDAPLDWKSYFLQKLRHYSISTRYSSFHQAVLSLFSGSHVGFFVLSITCLIIGNWPLIISLWIIRLFILMIASYSVFNRLDQEDLWYIIPFLDVMLSLHYIVFGFTFLLPKTKHW